MLHERLHSAQEKLQAQDVPFQIRLTSYLRICSFLLDETGGRYSKLMRALHQYNPDWWKTCTITATLGVESSDPIIADLLRPIQELDQVKSATENVVPLVA